VGVSLLQCCVVFVVSGIVASPQDEDSSHDTSYQEEDTGNSYCCDGSG